MVQRTKARVQQKAAATRRWKLIRRLALISLFIAILAGSVLIAYQRSLPKFFEQVSLDVMIQTETGVREGYVTYADEWNEDGSALAHIVAVAVKDPIEGVAFTIWSGEPLYGSHQVSEGTPATYTTDKGIWLLTGVITLSNDTITVDAVRDDGVVVKLKYTIVSVIPSIKTLLEPAA